MSGSNRKKISFARRLDDSSFGDVGCQDDADRDKARIKGFGFSWVASDLLAGLVVGCFIGFVVDDYLLFFPIFTLILGGLGFVGGMLNLYRRFRDES